MTTASPQQSSANKTAKKPRAPRAPRRPQAPIAPSVATPVEQPRTLYTHEPHPHTPRNANERHAAERQAQIAQHTGYRARLAAFNERFAVLLTAYVGTMWTAYGFAALAFVGLMGVLAILNPSVYTFIAWLSQTFIQLVLLPIIMVGQNVLNRRTELQADEAYHATMRTLHESEQTVRHLDAQDAELLRQTTLLTTLVERLSTPPAATPPTS